ncbi:MAG: DUF6940 family protein [Pirellulaceae bacterium]
MDTWPRSYGSPRTISEINSGGRLGEAKAASVNVNPVWLITAGVGVSWLYVRLDDRPKYYGYGPYCQWAFS